MIVRKYGRRGRAAAGGSYSGTDSFSDVVSDSPSQDCHQDVYDFTFSPRDSSHCNNWSDPYGFGSSQESRPLKSTDFGDSDRNRKKMKVFDVDSEPYSSSQETRAFGVLSISGGGGVEKSGKVKKVESDPFDYNSSEEIAILPRKKGGGDWSRKKWNVIDVDSSQETKGFGIPKAKKVDFDPFEYDSSPEVEEISVLPAKKVGESSRNFEFLEDGDVLKPSKFKNVDCDSYGLNSSQELSDLRVSLPRKSGNLEFDGVSRKSKKSDKREQNALHKKKRKNKNKGKLKEPVPENVVITTTLMETQEYGEMMEHEDEVNFALDGLKKGQQTSIRRASLLSLLAICGTAQQRRLLRVHGMAKTIIDAVLGLTLDDQASNLAAAALFYILTSDGHDDHLLDSPSCISFLIKLLKPLTSSSANEKAPTIGSKLLSMCKNAGLSQDSAKGSDSSSAAIKLKVQEILVHCKEMKPRDDHDNRMEDPKMSPKWISLLTMEKACWSTLSTEDTFGCVRRPRGHFKEKLREFGGLDAVFEVARKCHSIMEEWLEKSPTFSLDQGDDEKLESLLVAMKCLKIMENATFLSKDNQCHLLGMKGKFDGQRASRSFTKLILSVIKILSGVSLLSISRDKKLCGTSNGSAGELCSMELSASQKSFDLSQCFISSQTGQEPSQVSVDPVLLKRRVESLAAGLCTGASKDLDIIHISSDSSELESVGKREQISTSVGASGNSQDPFAFDDDDFEPSKWDVLSGNIMKPPSQESRPTVSEYRDESHSVLGLSQQESCNVENHQSQEASCSSTVDQEKSTLLADCLLTAVKVLMNLTNDNPEGCHQIAACGGLEVLSSLIAGHFPSFSPSFPHFLDLRESGLLPKSSPKIDGQSNKSLTDQELDFLVAILGLLVNLVEKDGHNRSRLAAATVSVPSVKGFGLEDETGVIPLLCSIFLANHGAGEAAGEGNQLSWDDEDSILQGEKEAEKMIVEAYSALLLAFLSTESKSIRDAIADYLPDQKMTILVPVLERFVEFHMTLNVISPETHKIVLEVIESCRSP